MIIEKIFEILSGKFGTKVLKEPYRRYWKVFTFGTVFIIMLLVFAWIIQLWSDMVVLANHVIWG